MQIKAKTIEEQLKKKNPKKKNIFKETAVGRKRI